MHRYNSGTTPVDHAETGTTGAIRNEKATVAGKAPKAETRTTTATWAAKKIENAKSRRLESKHLLQKFEKITNKCKPVYTQQNF